MNIKQNERAVIARPVPSRPSCSSYGSFSELLAGAINASPPRSFLENTVAAVRPKTIRFKPTYNRAPDVIVNSQTDLSGYAAMNISEKVIKRDVVYKPQAKLVSKATISLLANMGNFSTNHPQLLQPSEPCYVNNSNTHNESENLWFQPGPNTYHMETTQAIDNSKMVELEDPKPLANSDRPTFDGYNWRKYGQKQVKGSEFPRSYYKCTFPNCPVKKKVERSLDGQIAEIVYKGEHNHVKPQAPKRTIQGTDFKPEMSAFDVAINEVSIENRNDMGLYIRSPFQGKFPPPYEAGVTTNCAVGASDNLCGECEENDEPRSKRRKSESQSSEVAISSEGVQEPRIIVQSSAETEVLHDGFRWRKYGQKVVKGNPYPRSYYRCTSLKCNVRKHVERASDDSKAFITTYEGKHNHEMPLRSTTSLSASEQDLLAGSSKR